MRDEDPQQNALLSHRSPEPPGRQDPPLRKRQRIEEICGWMKTVVLWRTVRFRGRKRAATAYHRLRIRNLIGATA
jgi:hypothetical protein